MVRGRLHTARCLLQTATDKAGGHMVQLAVADVRTTVVPDLGRGLGVGGVCRGQTEAARQSVAGRRSTAGGGASAVATAPAVVALEATVAQVCGESQTQGMLFSLAVNAHPFSRQDHVIFVAMTRLNLEQKMWKVTMVLKALMMQVPCARSDRSA